MIINGIIWMEKFARKILFKHNVHKYEVEEIFVDSTKYHKAAKGKILNEDVYCVLGKTKSGRYLMVYFIYKKTQEALIISARQMTKRNKKHYGKK